MEQAIREPNGQFLPGKSGNPSGRPARDNPVKLAARKAGPEMIETLLGIARDADAPHASRVAAAREVLDRAYGRPEVNVDMKLQLQRLESLFQVHAGAMSEDQLRQAADLWDQVMQQTKVIEHIPDDDVT